MVGALVLISIFVLAVAIIAVVFFSQPAPLKLPAVAVSITNHSKIIEISHNSGDSILMSEFAVLVDDQPISYTCTDCGDSWSIGEVLTIDYSTHADFPNKVDILYKETGARQQLLTTRYLGTMTPTPTPFTPPTSPTSTVTPTPTQTPPVFAPVASFISNVTSGTTPLAVQFNDTSTNSPTSWAWVFGDGATSVLQNPVYTYTTAGNYTVTLTAQNSVGSNTTTRFITVSSPVSGNIILNAYKGAYLESGGEMQFHVTGSDSTVTVNGVTYPLSQGDTVRLVIENDEYGSIYSSLSSITTFSFSNVSFYHDGAYTNRGAVSALYVSGYDQYQSTLNLFMPPASAWTSFSVDGTSLINGQNSSAVRISGLKGAMNLQAGSGNTYFSGDASGYQILGPQVTGITPNSGAAGSTIIANISGMYFEPGATPVVKLQKGTKTITATSVSVPSSTQIQCTFSLTGAETGQWDVVVVNSDGRSGTGTNLFTVTPGPLTASFTYALPSSNIVNFTDTSTGYPTTWLWNFGDGTANSTAQHPPEHVYASAGLYTVTLTVTDGSGSSSAQQAIMVTLPASHTINLNAAKAAYVETGGAVQFRVTGLYSTITVNGVAYPLNQGDTIRLVVESDQYGSIYSSSTSITTFSFGDISFYQNGVLRNRGTVSSLYVSTYDQYLTTLNLYMPFASAWTSFSVDGTSLINGQSTSAVRISGLSGAMNLVASSSNAGYTGSASGYQILSPSAPQVTNITQNSAPTGTTVSITDLAGTGFMPGATVKLTRSGSSDIAATSVNVVSPTRITCQFSLAGAATGTWNVVVTNTDAQTGSLANGFSVMSPTPTVTAITPSFGTRGTSVPVTNLAGTGFLSGATVKLTRTGQADIVATGVTVSPTQISCTFNIVGAAAGQWNVVVTNTDLQSGTLTNGFTVNSPAPTLTARSPVSGTRGSPVSVTLTGTGFQPGATVNMTLSGSAPINAGNVVVVSPTQITCTFDLTGATASTNWAIQVTNTDGQASGAQAFTVNSPAPTLTARSPTSGIRGWPVSVTLTGTGFQSGATVNMTRSGSTPINAGSVVIVSPTQITCTFDLLGAAEATNWVIRVTNTDGRSSGTQAFSVTSATPTVGSTPAFSPNTGVRGTTGISITAPGTNLQPGMAVVLTRGTTTITAYNVNVISPTSVTFTIDIPTGATTGAYTARYTNTDGKTNTRTNRFTVT